MSTLYRALQTQVVKTNMARTSEVQFPAGFIDAMESLTARTEVELLTSFSNLNENASVLFMAAFNAELRALSQHEDAAVASLSKSLIELLKNNEKPVTLRLEDGSTIEPSSEDYPSAVTMTLNNEVQSYLSSLPPTQVEAQKEQVSTEETQIASEEDSIEKPEEN